MCDDILDRLICVPIDAILCLECLLFLMLYRNWFKKYQLASFYKKRNHLTCMGGQVNMELLFKFAVVVIVLNVLCLIFFRWWTNIFVEMSGAYVPILIWIINFGHHILIYCTHKQKPPAGVTNTFFYLQVIIFFFVLFFVCCGS